MEISSRFIDLALEAAGGTNAAINWVLETIARFAEADRAYLFEYLFPKNECNITHEWCREGIEAQIENLQGLSLVEFSDVIDLHRQGKALTIADVGGLSDGSFKELLAEQKIQSVILVPLNVGERCLGCVGFDFVRRPRQPHEVEQELLRAVARLLVTIRHLQQIQNGPEQNKQRLRALFEGFPDGAMFFFDHDLRIQSCGGVALERLGFTSEDLIGRRFPEVLPPDMAELSMPALEAVLRGEPRQFIASIGGRTFDWHYVPALERGGEVAFGVKILVDISERTRAQEALAASEERFRLLFADLPAIAVQGYTADGTTLYWNEGSQRLYGYSAEEALGKSMFELIIPEEMREGVRAAIKDLVERGEPIPAAPLSLVHKDGSRVSVHSSHGLVRRPGASPELFCIDIDLAPIERAEAERERLRLQLYQSQKMESVGRLAGGVAHDFNNMLSVILGHIEIALREVETDADLRVDLMEIRDAAQRSAALTRRLLAFARRQTIDPQDVNLNEVVEALLKMLRRLSGESIDLIWRPSKPLATVLIDPTQVDQLLTNLVVNARDAIAGAGKVIIETEEVELDETYRAQDPDFRPGRYVALVVSDDGPGIDEVILPHIFEPFFTSKSVGKGTGLGLATVYGIMRQNHGYAYVDSEVGRGTTFRLYFPARDVAPTVLPSTGLEPVRAEGQGTVLLVEDEKAVRKTTQKLLEYLGYKVLVADSAENALELAMEHHERLSLLLTDVVMPQMNGKELAEAIEERFPELKIVFMSGYSTKGLAQRGVLTEEVHFIQKPFTVSALAKLLHAVSGVEES